MSHHFLFIRRILLLPSSLEPFCCLLFFVLCLFVSRSRGLMSGSLLRSSSFFSPFPSPTVRPISHRSVLRSLTRLRVECVFVNRKGSVDTEGNPFFLSPTQRSSLLSPMEQMLKTLSSSGRAQLDTPQLRCSCIQATTIGTWICTCLGGCYSCS